MNNIKRKLRAWDRDNNCWFYFTIPDSFYVGISEDRFENWCDFTGLKDKNGKEIYEGDIIKVIGDYIHPDGRVIRLGNYKLQYEMAGFGIYRKEGWWRLDDFSVQVCPKYGLINKIEVIGNIYENLELLKRNLC